MKAWKETAGNNVVLKGEGFFISYNPSPCADMPIFASDGGSDETALCCKGEFLILNGDFRVEYEQVVDQGFEACKAVYNKHKDTCKSTWSNEGE